MSIKLSTTTDHIWQKVSDGWWGYNYVMKDDAVINSYYIDVEFYGNAAKHIKERNYILFTPNVRFWIENSKLLEYPFKTVRGIFYQLFQTFPFNIRVIKVSWLNIRLTYFTRQFIEIY